MCVYLPSLFFSEDSGRAAGETWGVAWGGSAFARAGGGPVPELPLAPWEHQSQAFPLWTAAWRWASLQLSPSSLIGRCLSFSPLLNTKNYTCMLQLLSLGLYWEPTKTSGKCFDWEALKRISCLYVEWQLLYDLSKVNLKKYMYHNTLGINFILLYIVL